MDDDNKIDPDKLKWTCKCGGQYGMDMEKVGVFHTYPTCAAYDALDVNELMKQRGALAMALYAMQKRAEA